MIKLRNRLDRRLAHPASIELSDSVYQRCGTTRCLTSHRSGARSSASRASINHQLSAIKPRCLAWHINHPSQHVSLLYPIHPLLLMSKYPSWFARGCRPAPNPLKSPVVNVTAPHYATSDLRWPLESVRTFVCSYSRWPF